MSTSIENNKRKLTKKSDDSIEKKKKVHFSIENSENEKPKKVFIIFSKNKNI